MFPRIDKNERIQLAMNNTMAMEVSSSMNVFCEILKSFREVRTMKHPEDLTMRLVYVVIYHFDFPYLLFEH